MIRSQESGVGSRRACLIRNARGRYSDAWLAGFSAELERPCAVLVAVGLAGQRAFSAIEERWLGVDRTERPSAVINAQLLDGNGRPILGRHC